VSIEQKPSITFIGAGNMASSLIGGMIADHYPPGKIWGTDPDLDKLQHLREFFNINVTQSNMVGTEASQVLVLAVKPVALKQVLIEAKDIIQAKKPLILSIVTGVRSNTILTWTQCQDLPIVRSMPNTPALLQAGTTGLWANEYVTEKEKRLAESILRAVGITLWVDKETDLDAVTAISGSGPAYFFLVMEAILECAKKMGLGDKQAELLTIHTALGAARMALESGKDVTTLRKQVTSPGGTTEQAIRVFESGGLRELFNEALQAARQKAVEISQLLD
jgi:pyrroline-5-carboxylate reductase